MRLKTVWTKQHEDVVKALHETGRHIAKKQYILHDLEEHAPLVLEVYDWLVKNSPNFSQKPADVQYPIWVSDDRAATMLPSAGMVILELSLDPSLIAYVNIEKWGRILNYAYLAADEEDAKSHRQLLEQYGVSDTKAYMSQFYPQIKRKIIDSWGRLFDDTALAKSGKHYGNIWEIRAEWVTAIIR